MHDKNVNQWLQSASSLHESNGLLVTSKPCSCHPILLIARLVWVPDHHIAWPEHFMFMRMGTVPAQCPVWTWLQNMSSIDGHHSICWQQVHWCSLLAKVISLKICQSSKLDNKILLQLSKLVCILSNVCKWDMVGLNSEFVEMIFVQQKTFYCSNLHKSHWIKYQKPHF